MAGAASRKSIVTGLGNGRVGSKRLQNAVMGVINAESKRNPTNEYY
jgi:hypothetical protein